MKIRRVVTGYSADGKSIFSSDEQLEGTTVGLMPGLEIHRLWGDDKAPIFPDDGEQTQVKVGDTIIQNCTRHAWRNKSDELCRTIFCMVGAHRV